MTAGQIINRALRLLKVIDPEAGPTAPMQQNALETLNSMLEFWSTTNLVWIETTEQFDLVGGTDVYTMGPSGDFDTTRPEKIGTAFIRYSGLDYPLVIDVNGSTYAGIADKLETGRPRLMWVNPTMTTATLTFWPVPDENYPLYIYSKKPLGQYAAASSEIVLPSGFDRMIGYNLALELGDEYGTLAQTTVALAAESFQKLKDHYGPKPQGVVSNPFRAGRFATPNLGEGVTFGGQSVVFGGGTALW